jgi:hypothetical protein
VARARALCKNARNSGSYSHVEWRSIAEVIQYLGELFAHRSGGLEQHRRERSSHGLSLLNELISTAKIPGDIPNTQSLQIVPPGARACARS